MSQPPRARNPRFETVRLQHLLKEVRRPVNVREHETYREIGVRSHGRGVFHKAPVTGEVLGNKRVFWMKPGALVFNIVFAWERAVAVLSESEDGMIGSHRFPTYDAIPGRAEARFLQYYFTTGYGHYLLELNSPGAAGRNKTLSQSALMKEEIRVPPAPEQRAIADFLDHKTAAIDALIEKKERLLELLAEKRAALIHRAVTKGLDGAGGGPEVPMKDSGVPWIGEIPAHWSVSRVKFECDNLNFRRIPLSTQERGTRQGEFPYYGASGVIDHVDDFLFDETTILVAEDGANLVLRNLPLAIIATGQYWVNNHAHILRPRDQATYFWAPLLESLDYRPFISGSAQPKLTAEAIGNVLVGVPPTVEERLEIAAHVREVAATTDAPRSRLVEQLGNLREYRQALITAAVTGQLDIPGAA